MSRSQRHMAEHPGQYDMPSVGAGPTPPQPPIVEGVAPVFHGTPGPQLNVVDDEVLIDMGEYCNRGDPPGVFSAANLPPGVEIDLDGIISGVCTEAFSKQAGVTCTNDTGQAIKRFNWTVEAGG